ncbi:MAG TPA: efflux RND transporter periplasmic adaptor subunit, partial [Anaerolineae bacterium]
VQVTRGEVRQLLTVPGQITPAQTLTLSFSAAGQLLEVDVRPGDQITVGKTIAVLNPDSLKLALAQAQADWQTKQDALTKVKQGSYPNAADTKQAEASALAADYALKNAQADLTGATMLAPVSGRILTVSANAGDQVSAKGAVATMADLTKLEIQTTVGQADVVLVQPGQAAAITLDARPGETFSGKVNRVVPQKASTSGAVTYNVFVSVDKPPAGLLPGMTADADIIVEDRTNVLTLPRRSIRAKANATVPLPVLQAGETITRNVKIGLVGDLNVEILSGLQEGDRVVTP